jgi:hypothetical protein
MEGDCFHRTTACRQTTDQTTCLSDLSPASTFALVDNCVRRCLSRFQAAVIWVQHPETSKLLSEFAIREPMAPKKESAEKAAERAAKVKAVLLKVKENRAKKPVIKTKKIGYAFNLKYCLPSLYLH